MSIGQFSAYTSCGPFTFCLLLMQYTFDKGNVGKFCSRNFNIFEMRPVDMKRLCLDTRFLCPIEWKIS
jgi:hypothetical protein